MEKRVNERLIKKEEKNKEEKEKSVNKREIKKEGRGE